MLRSEKSKSTQEDWTQQCIWHSECQQRGVYLCKAPPLKKPFLGSQEALGRAGRVTIRVLAQACHYHPLQKDSRPAYMIVELIGRLRFTELNLFGSPMPTSWLLGKAMSFGRIQNEEIVTDADFKFSGIPIPTLIFRELIRVADTDADTDADCNVLCNVLATNGKLANSGSSPSQSPKVPVLTPQVATPLNGFF